MRAFRYSLIKPQSTSSVILPSTLQVTIAKHFLVLLALGGTLGGTLSSASVGISSAGISSIRISSIRISRVGISRVGVVVVVLASSIDLLLGQDLAGVGQGRGGGLDTGGGSSRLLDGGLLKNGTVTGGRRAANFRHVSVSERPSTVRKRSGGLPSTVDGVEILLQVLGVGDGIVDCRADDVELVL